MVYQISPLEAELIFKLILAAILGGVVGIERELHYKYAGLRTHALVCMGSALFAIISISVTGSQVDASRIAAGVVTGIGFLGAGTIFFAKNKLHGLTTAANLWVLAAIGIATGIGMYAAAIAATVIVFLVLLFGHAIEKKALKKKM
ncbi:MAG: MgtC/SapB family protein [Candidatus Aenigmatarchaeota archaeon]